MKRIILAAGALLIGTSAMAWAPSSVPVAHSDKAPTVAMDPGAKAPATLVVAKSNDLPTIVGTEAASASWIADDQTLAETAPQPAAASYPPCRPGPGDDHCIQLYEPGVRAALASWNPPADTTLAAELGAPTAPGDASAYTGMGGPEEEVLAMNGDGAVDAALGETAVDEGADAAGYTGVGGPLEEVATTDYPPCSPGPGDDRCIQLYERGVTGR
jgi:hypothetical protein